MSQPIVHHTDFLKSEIKRLQTVIFEGSYECRIKQRDLYDVDYLQKVGLPSSGIGWLDQELDNQLVDVHMSINRMTECVKNGYNFYIQYPDTYAGIIYKAIVDYIRYYGELSDRFPNLPLPDQEDFELLDALATKIYTVYRNFEKAEDTAGMVGRIRRLRRRTFGNAPEQIEIDKEIDEAGNVINKEHTSLMDLFADRMAVKKIPNYDSREE